MASITTNSTKLSLYFYFLKNESKYAIYAWHLHVSSHNGDISFYSKPFDDKVAL